MGPIHLCPRVAVAQWLSRHRPLQPAVLLILCLDIFGPDRSYRPWHRSYRVSYIVYRNAALPMARSQQEAGSDRAMHEFSNRGFGEHLRPKWVTPTLVSGKTEYEITGMPYTRQCDCLSKQARRRLQIVSLLASEHCHYWISMIAALKIVALDVSRQTSLTPSPHPLSHAGASSFRSLHDHERAIEANLPLPA